MQNPISKSIRMLLPLIAAGLVTLAMGSVHAMVNGQTAGGPSVGNLIDFPAAGTRGHSNHTVLATRVDGSSCVLDTREIREFGGSLVVTERRLTDGLTIRVHWAGRRSAAGTDDCGISADLLLNKRDVTALLHAAGGYGPAMVRSQSL